MEYIEGLVTAFGTPTVVIAIVAFLLWFNKKHTAEHEVIMKQLARDSEHLHEITMMTLRSAITNPNLPRSARLELFDRYKVLGGNSWIEEYVEKHLLNDEVPHRRHTDQ